MPTLDAVPQRAPRAWTTAAGARAVSPGAVVLAAALPILFLHVDFQPAVHGPGGATFKLQDAAVLAALVAAAAVAAREGAGRLRAARAVWVALGLLLAWIVVATVFPLAYGQAYAWRTHLLTAGEYVEYALLAPALPFLVRRRNDWLLAGAALVAWSTAATLVAAVQWSGWRILEGWPQGRRQPSFVGTHDFAALSGMTLGVGLLALVWGVVDRRERRVAWLAIVSGALGFALSGTSAGLVGLLPAAVLAGVVAFRRGLLSRRVGAAGAAVVVLASAGVLALRANDFDHFFRFVGASSKPAATTGRSTHVQTYSQRTLTAYIGLRIWQRHPVVGAGWQASTEDSVVGRELPAAHRRFPTLAPLAFPGPGHEYGVQLLYVQALSDLGVVGLLLLLACLGIPVAVALRLAFGADGRTALAATLGLFWLLLAAGLFTAEGFVAGIPTDALLWLAIGAIGAAASMRRAASA